MDVWCAWYTDAFRHAIQQDLWSRALLIQRCKLAVDLSVLIGLPDTRLVSSSSSYATRRHPINVSPIQKLTDKLDERLLMLFPTTLELPCRESIVIPGDPCLGTGERSAAVCSHNANITNCFTAREPVHGRVLGSLVPESVKKEDFSCAWFSCRTRFHLAQGLGGYLGRRKRKHHNNKKIPPCFQKFLFFKFSIPELRR
jgi:hypothetical protein